MINATLKVTGAYLSTYEEMTKWFDKYVNTLVELHKLAPYRFPVEDSEDSEYLRPMPLWLLEEARAFTLRYYQIPTSPLTESKFWLD